MSSAAEVVVDGAHQPRDVQILPNRSQAVPSEILPGKKRGQSGYSLYASTSRGHYMGVIPLPPSAHPAVQPDQALRLSFPLPRSYSRGPRVGEGEQWLNPAVSTDSSPTQETLRKSWNVHPSLPCPHEWHRTNRAPIGHFPIGDPQDFTSYVTDFTTMFLQTNTEAHNQHPGTNLKAQVSQPGNCSQPQEASLLAKLGASPPWPAPPGHPGPSSGQQPGGLSPPLVLPTPCPRAAVSGLGCNPPSLTSSFQEAAHSLRKMLAPVRLPSPPMTHRCPAVPLDRL